MIFVPLPLVVSLLLVPLLVRLLRQGEWQQPAKRPFLILTGLYTLQSALIALRWGYDVLALIPAVAIVAAVVAPMAWLSFRQLATGRTLSLAESAPHGLPALAVALMFLVWRAPLSLAMILIFLCYGAALLWLARRGPDALVSARLEGALYSHRSMALTGLAMIASALSDVAISLDYQTNGGSHGAMVVALGNLVALLGLGWAAAIAGTAQIQADQDEDEDRDGAAEAEAAQAKSSSAEDAETFAALEQIMRERALYRDSELNLTRIARKMGLPARRISNAVNRSAGLSVSHYVNDYRIRAACQQLEETQAPITRIMFDSGFLSKSNFNREFARVTGMTPTAFRRKHQPDATSKQMAQAFLSP